MSKQNTNKNATFILFRFKSVFCFVLLNFIEMLMPNIKVPSTKQDAAERKSTILQYIEKKMDKELYRLYGIIF